MVLQKTITGRKRQKLHSEAAGGPGLLSWDPAANSVLIYLRTGTASKTEVEDGGVIVERDRSGDALNLEILCVRQGIKPMAYDVVASYSSSAAEALCKLVGDLPESPLEVPLS